MFFRRAVIEKPSFQQRVKSLEGAGFTVVSQPGGTVRVSRDGCAVELKESDRGVDVQDRAGLIMCNDEIGVLVDGGFQKFFRTPTGMQTPALADQLKALHAFEADLKEHLGMKNLYNQSLGTVSTLYLYDRVKDRDRGVPKRVWE